MIKFRFEEVRRTEEAGDVIVLHEYCIRPDDIKMWDLQKYSLPVKKDEEVDGVVVTKEEVLEQEVLTVTMKDTISTYKEVEVPYYKSKVLSYRKELKEVQENINHFFTGEEIKDVLSQLEKYFS